MDIESGLVEVWCGREGERREMILDSSLLYHSESDSGSESSVSSDSSKKASGKYEGERGDKGADDSVAFLKGCKREGEMGQSSSNREEGRGLCFVMTRG